MQFAYHSPCFENCFDCILGERGCFVGFDKAALKPAHYLGVHGALVRSRGHADLVAHPLWEAQNELMQAHG